ncbi:MAG: S53 family peptidase [Bacteroidota bacterium]
MEKIILDDSHTQPWENSTHLGPSPAHTILDLSIYLDVPDNGKNAYKAAKLDSSNHLSYDDLVRLRSAHQAHLDLVVKYVSEHDLKVTEINPARRRVLVSGTAEAIRSAFGVDLHDFSHPNGDYMNHDQPFRIPASLQGIVTCILGTDTRKVASRSAHNATQIEANATNSLPTRIGSFTAMQVAEAYNFPTQYDGTGQTIGIVELSGGYRDSDFDTYFNAAGIKRPNIIAVGPNNPGPLDNPADADGEVALDVEVAGSVCPGAKFVVYFSKSGATQQGFLDVLETAIHDTTNNPSVISVSWGGPEVPGNASYAKQFQELCNDAISLGITLLFSSGDKGSPNGLPGGYLAPNFPASLPNVLACGGTMLKASGSTIESEVVWGELSLGEGASGGGVSTLFALPDYQSNSDVPIVPPSGIKPGFKGRGVPDVAGNAAPNTGYAVYVNGKYGVVGGTSAVAPLWAALIILINQHMGKRAGYLNEKLYQLADTKCFRDITKGTNGTNGSLYSARSGWDACTGLGSPDGMAIMNALTSDS